MGQRGRAAIIILGWLAVVILTAQNPSIDRISRLKILTGEGRLKNGVLKVSLNQDQRFTNASTYFVSVTMIDSSTAVSPDSSRHFTIKNLSPTGFHIRSARFTTDTVKVRWCAIGE
jgi:hypothetical protein